MTDTRRRVKLYALNAERQWDDKGTGHVSSSYVERLRGVSLLVRAESDGSLLLESRIQPNTAYQKQQETLIVWSEGDNYDLALSFQERVGCDEIWAKICQVQGKDPSVETTQETMEEDDERYEENSNDAIELPPCEVDKLDELSELIANCLVHPLKRERIATSLETEDYIKKLLKLFHECEESNNVKSLHKLHDIFKNVFLLNKNPLFEVMLGEDALFDVVGVFEYDPNAPQPKKHRDYLKSVSRFKEVIPFGNTELINKIHQTYRVQYIQDIVLPTPSVFEENMLSTLSSFIFFNKVEIVSLIQEDDKFLRELFKQITDESTDVEKRKDLVLFLKEFCTFSQTLQPQARDNFFKALSTLGVLQTLEVTLASDNLLTRSASVDILTHVVEYSPSMVREYALQQESSNCEEDQFIINIVIEQMICDPDPDLGMATQLSSILRLLLDPENMLAASAVNKSEKTDFLAYFYKHCMHVLVAPVLANTAGEKPCQESGRTAQLLSIILELLSFCVEHHLYHIRNYIISHDLLKRILVLMTSKHTFLVLSALRFMRKIIGLKDEFYNRHIMNSNLFSPVVEAFKQNNGRYNLLDSAIIEVFEFVKSEEIRSLCVYIIEKFGKFLDKIEYVGTFKALRQQYELYQEKLKERNSLENSPVILRNDRYRRDARQMEQEEELWFDSDDVDDMDNNLSGSLSYKLEAEFDQFSKKIVEKRSNLGIPYNDIEGVKKYNDLENVKTLSLNRGTGTRRITPLTTSQTSPSLPHMEVQTTRKGGLVDYPDEDSDEEDNGEEVEDTNNLNHTKRARLNS